MDEQKVFNAEVYFRKDGDGFLKESYRQYFILADDLADACHKVQRHLEEHFALSEPRIEHVGEVEADVIR